MALAKIIKLRPARPALVPDGPVSVEWDDTRGLYVAVCARCTETLTSERLDQADEFADEHRCDPELAALLVLIGQRAA